MAASTDQAHAEAQVRAWGYRHVFTWTDGPNTHYPPHRHRGATTHLVLAGSLTVCYPGDARAERRELCVGDRWDVDAGRLHEVWVGAGGCRYVIGE
ncbi:cupin-type protein [Stagonosporopsis vannaccii]|nr:cupin-type protein [Stagonosporopsis vannaccii]